MSVRIANGREVSNDAANLSWRFDQEVLRPRNFGDFVDFCARVALETEMINSRFHFVLYHHQNERRVFAVSNWWPQPNIVSAFFSPVANDR